MNKLGWRPKVTIVNAVSSASGLMALPPPASTEGAVSIVFTKDPANPAWAKDKGLKLFQTVMKRYYADGVKSGYAAAGASSAYTMVDALKKAGKDPTRASLVNGGDAPERARQPVPPPGDRREDHAARPLSGLAAAAAALAQGPLEHLREDAGREAVSSRCA